MSAATTSLHPESMTTPEFMARHRFARLTSRKAGLIADLIRGRDVNEALELLQFTPNRGAAFYLKVVRSAVANASQDENVNVNRLYVSDARADVGPLLNHRMRYRPGPQGRAMPFAKRLSHLTIKVREREEETEEGAGRKRGKRAAKKPAKKAAAKSTKQKSQGSAEAAPKRKAKKEQAS